MNRIVHLALKVDDLERTTEFYQKVFGFREVETKKVRDHSSRHLTDGAIDFALIKYDAGSTFGDAIKVGLINKCVPQSELVRETLKWCETMKGHSSQTLRMTKKMLEAEWTMELATALEAEAQAQALMMLGGDHTEFHRSFVEKRSPKFTGN